MYWCGWKRRSLRTFSVETRLAVRLAIQPSVNSRRTFAISTFGESTEIRAAGISVLSPKVDIANVRLEFTDGCIANLTASRVSTEKVRKLRLFQPHQYISVDYAKQAAAVFTVGGEQGLAFEQLPVQAAEPLKLQFDAFLDAIETRGQPKLNGTVARRTLELAL